MDRTVQLLKALAEPTRLRIAALCRHGGDLAVSELVRILGQSQPRVSRHLKLLTEAGVLSRIPEGSWVFYRISTTGGAADIINAALAKISDDDTTLRRDHERLEKVKSERAAAAESYFSANAAAWGQLRALHVDQRDVNNMLMEIVAGDNLGELLDIGTGTAEMLRLFSDRIIRGEGIDRSRDMLSFARNALEASELAHCHVRYGDLYALPYEPESYDTVIIHQVLHFVDDTSAAIAEAGRVLRHGGRLIIADFAPHDIEELRTQHQHRRLGFADTDFDHDMAAAGLSMGQVRHLQGNPLTVTIWRAVKA